MEPTETADKSRDERIAVLAREVESLETALRTGRMIRLGLIALLVIFTLGMTWRFVALAQELRSEQNLDALTKVGEKHFEDRLPLIRKELQVLVDQSSPVVVQAFYAEAKQDMPKFLQAIEQQREPLAASLKEKLHDRLVATYERALHEKIDILAQEIPEATDPVVQERVEAHFNTAFARLVDKYYVEQLVNQLETMFAAWDAFPAEPPQAGGPPLPDLVIGNLLEVMSAKLGNNDVQSSMASAIANREPVDNASPDATAPRSGAANSTEPSAEPNKAKRNTTEQTGDTP